MRRIIHHLSILSAVLFLVSSLYTFHISTPASGAPPYAAEDLTPPSDPHAWILSWKRPDGPARVGLQAGHWKNEELPDELVRLIGSTGASGGGRSEWEVNLEIATLTKEILEKEGILVDILPATVPERYYADAFVAIHADGSLDRNARGYKLSPPRRDYSGYADSLAEHLKNSYSRATGLPEDPMISRNMTGYYAFAWWRYNHSVHPRAASVIFETGFLTSAADRQIIVNQPHRSADGLARGIISYLKSRELL